MQKDAKFLFLSVHSSWVVPIFSNSIYNTCSKLFPVCGTVSLMPLCLHRIDIAHFAVSTRTSRNRYSLIPGFCRLCRIQSLLLTAQGNCSPICCKTVQTIPQLFAHCSHKLLPSVTSCPLLFNVVWFIGTC